MSGQLTMILRWAVVNVLAAVSFVLLVVTEAHTAGYLVGAAALLLMFVPFRRGLLGRFALAQALLASGVLVVYVADEPAGPMTLLALTCGLVVVTIAVEPILRTLGAVPAPMVANLAGFEAKPLPVLGLETVLIADALLIVAAGAFAIQGWPVLGLLLVVVVIDLATLVMLLDRLRIRIARRSETDAAIAHLDEWAPEFAVYFSGPRGASYQLLMWLPYLERVGVPFVVVLREQAVFAEISAVTNAPVLVRKTLADLDTVITPSLRAIVYVNNGMKNTHAVRFSHLTHIQLLHGDSDKPPSFSPVTAMYDRIFTAGQAGIDRYARKGVSIPVEKFRIVGRPQVERVAPARGPIGDLSERTVLYAPTWTGHFGDTDYCSLHLAEPIVRGLLARGATVLVRHHPYSLRNPESKRHIDRLAEVLAEDAVSTGRAHRWGPSMQDEIDLFECFNLVDALVADVSSVVSDFLYSGKPVALVAISGSGPEFLEDFPLATAAYVIEGDLHNLDTSLDELLGADRLEEVRREARAYYLGDIEPDRYTEAFLQEMRRCV